MSLDSPHPTSSSAASSRTRQVALISEIVTSTPVPMQVRLHGLDPAVRRLLLALAVGFDLADALPPSLGISSAELDELIAEARAAGLLQPDGHLEPHVHEALLAATPEYQVRSLQRSLLDSLAEQGRPLDGVARDLAKAGLRDPRIAGFLERAADAALAVEPELAAELYDEADAAGSDELATAARRAQAAAASGDIDSAGRILDDLLSRDDVPDLVRAVDAAAAMWSHRAMLARGAEIYRWLGAARLGSSAPLAEIAMIGVGDVEGATAMADARPSSVSPTLFTVAVDLMGQGIRESIRPDGGQPLPALVRAADAMTASGLAVPMPEYPAALAALVALHCGEIGTAETVLGAALREAHCGSAARPRLFLLSAWTAMLSDRLTQARQNMALATAGEHELTTRDEFLLRALEVGIARRADDVPALLKAWECAREALLHVTVDLFSLLPLGELVVTAARMRDSTRMSHHLADAWALLGRLGDPPLWSAQLHWSALQAAILSERPKELAPHAATLVRAASRNDFSSVLAIAARAWVAVLGGTFEVGSVESAARGLASVGLTWDGSRLAGHAAARADERRDLSRLLACARELHPGDVVVAVAPGPNRSERDRSGLSPREREVARLVLEGKTYREIGEAIFVSPRTAEHHIAQIRTRLGVSSRSELLMQLRVVLGNDRDPQHDETSFP